jgi:hypothetical protein
MQATSRFLVAFATEQSQPPGGAQESAPVAGGDGQSGPSADQQGDDVSHPSPDQGLPPRVPAAFINYRFEPGYHGEPVL